jgi:hypothetical protein
MTLLGLLAVILILMIAVWVARSVPVPFSYIVYALVVLVICIVLLQVTGVLGSGGLNRRITSRTPELNSQVATAEQIGEQQGDLLTMFPW